MAVPINAMPIFSEENKKAKTHTRKHMSSCKLLKETSQNYSFIHSWPCLTEVQANVNEWSGASPLWCAKLGKKNTASLFHLERLGHRLTHTYIHQNLSKKAFWWNFKVCEAMWSSKLWSETITHSTDVSIPQSLVLKSQKWSTKPCNPTASARLAEKPN